MTRMPRIGIGCQVVSGEDILLQQIINLLLFGLSMRAWDRALGRQCWDHQAAGYHHLVVS